MKTAIEKNIKYSDKYFQKIPKIKDLDDSSLLKKIIHNSKRIVDLGCGDGNFITSVMNIDNKKILSGVDISPRRIEYLKNKFPEKRFVCADVCETGLKSNYFDFVISEQVIEHVEDDNKMVKEIDRISKNGAFIYVTSVIKKPWAIYKYINNRKFVLDPTHEREYNSKEEFLKLFDKKFKLINVNVYPVKRKKIVTFRIPGYYTIHGLWKK